MKTYGIKFPITVDDGTTLFDMNKTRAQSVHSELMHLVFTPKGQKLRDPEFGTNLIQFIFNPNDAQTWDDVVFDARTAIERYIPNCQLNDIKVEESDNGLGIVVNVYYSVNEGGQMNNYQSTMNL